MAFLPPDMPELENEEDLLDALSRRGKPTWKQKLSSSDESAIINRVIRDAEDGALVIDDLRNDRTEWIKSWRNDVEERDYPFEGAANIRTPLTSSLTEQSKARYFEVLFNSKPIFTSLDPTVSPEALQDLTDWFWYELSQIVDIKTAGQRIIHNTHVLGTDFVVPRWSVEYRPSNTQYSASLTAEPLLDQMLAMLQEAFIDSPLATPEVKGKGKFRVTFSDQSGELHIAECVFGIQDAQLILSVDRPELSFEGVRLDPIEFEDLLVINSADTVDLLPAFVSRLWLSTTEFEQFCRTPNFFRKLSDEDKDAVIRTSSNKTSQVGITQPVTTSADAVEGTQSQDGISYDLDRRWIEVLRWEGLWSRAHFEAQSSPSGDSRSFDDAREIIFWVVPAARKVIRMARQEDLNPAGGRTPVKFDFIKQPGRFFSWSLVGWLRHLQATNDMIYNQRLDAGLLANNPFWFYGANAGLGQTSLSLAPGEGVPCRDVNQILFPKIPWSPTFGIGEEQILQRYAYAQAGLSASDVGQFVSKRTTASEFTSTQGAGDIRMKYILVQYVTSLSELYRRIFALYRRNMKPGRVYQVSNLEGERLVRTLDPNLLLKPVKITLEVDPEKISSQAQRDIAVNMLSLLLNGFLIQTGIVQPDTIYAAVEKVVNASNYKGVPIHRPDLPEKSDPPELEHRQMLENIPVRGPTPTENFADHLRAHIAILSDPTFLSVASPDAQQALTEHIQKTYQVANTVQTIRQTAAEGAGQMQDQMKGMGIAPEAMGGSQIGDNAEPGTAEEGVIGEYQ